MLLDTKAVSKNAESYLIILLRVDPKFDSSGARQFISMGYVDLPGSPNGRSNPLCVSGPNYSGY